MAYQYSNPYIPLAPPAPRSTFNAISTSSHGSQILFGGLPLDVTEKDIRDLLINDPLALPASTTSARSIYTQESKFTGFAIVTVGNDVDAERIRREYSGETIDGTFRLTVQHILSPTQPFPSASNAPQPFAPPPQAVPRPPPAAPVWAPQALPPRASVQQQAPRNAQNEKAPGLKLLARLSGPGGSSANSRQGALLAQQKANLNGGGRPGAALLSRIAKPNAKPSPAAKVNRAKQAIAVERAPAASKPKAKTQAELDEEMRLYTRQSRFT